MRLSTQEQVFTSPTAKFQIGYAFRLGSIQELNVEVALEPSPIEIVYAPNANRWEAEKYGKSRKCWPVWIVDNLGDQV